MGTPGKYERVTKSNFPVTEKLMNGALVTPTPGWMVGAWLDLDIKSLNPVNWVFSDERADHFKVNICYESLHKD